MSREGGGLLVVRLTRAGAHSPPVHERLQRELLSARFNSAETHSSCAFQLYSVLKQYFIKHMAWWLRGTEEFSLRRLQRRFSVEWNCAQLPVKRADVRSVEKVEPFNRISANFCCCDWHWHVMASVSWRHALFFLLVGKLNWFVLFMSAFPPISLCLFLEFHTDCITPMTANKSERNY